MYIEKHSNPDALAVGTFIDFKRSITGNKNTMQNRSDKATKQVDAMYMSLEGDLSINDADRFINGKTKAISDRGIEGFRVVLSDKNGKFKDFVISKKRLVESPFLGEPKLSPSFGSNIQSSKSDVNPSIYGKNVDFLRSTASTLVPYTTEQPVGRIKVGSPVDSADIRTLLATDTSMTAY